jgi:hypothetical protein
MPHVTTHIGEHAARVLALVAAANGQVKECELHALEELDAFARLGVSRRRFLQLAQKGLEDVGGRLCERGHLHVADLLYLDDLLGEVGSRERRRLVCRLAAAVITADGCVTAGERAAYDYILMRWKVDTPTVAQAIRADASC